MIGSRSQVVRDRSHVSQNDLGETMERPAGTRSATTLRKLPMAAPRANANTINNSACILPDRCLRVTTYHSARWFDRLTMSAKGSLARSP